MNISADGYDGLYIELGRRIAAIRSNSKITQEELAAAVSLSRTSITNIECGRQKIQVHTLLQIAAFFDVDAIELLPQLQAEKASALSLESIEDESARMFMKSAKPDRGEEHGREMETN